MPMIAGPPAVADIFFGLAWRHPAALHPRA